MNDKCTLVFDFETTTKNKGNVFTPENYACLLVVYHVEEDTTHVFQQPFDDSTVLALFNRATNLIGFNLKFDLAWMRRTFNYIPANTIKLFDCQYAEFIFSCQTMKYPSLNECCAIHGLPQKYDIVKEEYWEKGIDTPDIPIEILVEYCVQDVKITYELFKKQFALFLDQQNSKYKLFRVAMQDLPVLLEMEWNGLKYNVRKSQELAEDIMKQVTSIEEQLNKFTDGVPVRWNSREDISKFLYGGIIKHDYQVPIGVYKSGAKVGHTKYKWMVQEYTLPGLFEPLKGSEGAKEGIYSTDETTLRSLKGSKTQKKILGWLLERTKLMKLVNTYLLGLPKKLDEMGWGDTLHPSYNQCVTVTGRIASSNPNGQNLDPKAKQLCETRYGTT